MRAWYDMARKCEEDYGSQVDTKKVSLYVLNAASPFMNVIGASLSCRMKTVSTSALFVRKLFNRFY